MLSIILPFPLTTNDNLSPDVSCRSTVLTVCIDIAPDSVTILFVEGCGIPLTVHPMLNMPVPVEVAAYVSLYLCVACTSMYDGDTLKLPVSLVMLFRDQQKVLFLSLAVAPVMVIEYVGDGGGLVMMPPIGLTGGVMGSNGTGGPLTLIHTATITAMINITSMMKNMIHPHDHPEDAATGSAGHPYDGSTGRITGSRRM